MSYSIYHQLVINQDANIVFDGFTMPNHLEQWWPLKCSGEPQMGALYNFNFTDQYDWYAVVTKLEVNTCCTWKMTRSDDDWAPTSFGFELESADIGTTLKFFHQDWKAQNEHFKVASYCWAILLKGLKDYLENGLVIPFEERS